METIAEIENLERKLQSDPQFFTESIDEHALLADAAGRFFSKNDFVQFGHPSQNSVEMKIIKTKIKTFGHSAIVSSAIEMAMPGFSGALNFIRVWTNINNQLKIIIFLLEKAAGKLEGR